MRGIRERWRAWWRLRGCARLDVDQAREGELVQVTGVVHPVDEGLVGPLTGIACVAYRSRVRGYTTIGGKRGGSGWQTTMQVRPFTVERDDGGGSIVVDGDHAIFGVHPRPLLRRHADRRASFRVRHAIEPGLARFDEVLVEVGTQITVGGALVLVPRDSPPTAEGGFRDLPPVDRQIAGSRDTPLIFVERDP